MPATDASSASNMRSLERAIDVLEVLDSSTQPLRLSEISRRAGLHVATTKRILTVLESRGRVEHDEAGFRAGLALLFGAHAYLESSPLVAHARPVVQELASVTGYTASLFARSGLARAVVLRVEGTSPMRYVLPTGERLPLTLGAGKVLAAYLEPDELERLVESEQDHPSATGERQTRAELDRDLAAVREQGYYFALQERAIGVGSIAAPILNAEGRCVAGIQIAGRVQELTELREQEVAVEVRRAAAVIAQKLG
ncbi:IclR family transcriptional regulator [Agrococcus baldri]|uniref:IclR family transcriptional regulator n=1 Tax=Agrococcus baldri TaxID=153730 RepID=A0AA87UR24_9MICO|nr:IclR family transcriptional regulator [Agrococcus baldri]GEK79080.1 IclR family transcriptional regulator [Agrococcus baldri]